MGILKTGSLFGSKLLGIYTVLCRWGAMFNYSYIIINKDRKSAICIDPSEHAPVDNALSLLGVKLSAIYITHSHFDHVDGILFLKEKYKCIVYGPSGEAQNIPGIDQTLEDEEVFVAAGYRCKVVLCSGHSKGALSYYFPELGSLFVGDNLFVMGCGRVNNGQFKEMQNSLRRLVLFPPETRVYSGHEYTKSNIKFAMQRWQADKIISARSERLLMLLENSIPIVPTTIGIELLTNIFLISAAKDKYLNIRELCPSVPSFEQLRREKDSF